MDIFLRPNEGLFNFVENLREKEKRLGHLLRDVCVFVEVSRAVAQQFERAA